MSKPKYKSKFKSKDEWLVNSKCRDLIRKVQKDVHSAYCYYGMKEISIVGQSIKALNSHIMSQKFLRSCP